MSVCNKINNLTKMCDCLNGQKLINYKIAKTGGNDPSISKAMRYSQYVRTTRSVPIILSSSTNPNLFGGGSITLVKSSLTNMTYF